MKLFAPRKLELVGKSLMDLAKVIVVAAGLFSAASKFRLLGWVLVVILFFAGWLIYPADKGEGDV